VFGATPESLATYTAGSVSCISVQVCFECSEARSSKPAFDDVQLGCLLGQGSYGKVYRGDWGGKEVAVKVIQDLTLENC
jgi:hypothetical protein